jgi:hypothetical protein
MKDLFALLMLILTPLATATCFGQVIAIENIKNNYAYPMITNLLQIVVEGVKCEEL